MQIRHIGKNQLENTVELALTVAGCRMASLKPSQPDLHTILA
jgi:hypothetical protein